MIAPARRAATEVLAAVDAGRWDLATALAQAHPSLADARDRALLTELATGVQRWKLALDFAIHALTKRQPADLDADVRATLRLGLYQLQHATRIPASAVVNDAVEIVKRGPTRSASGMVNAVLRRVVREGPPMLPEAPRVPVDDPRWRTQALAWLAITHSHPAWLVERWLDRFGFEATEAWVRYDNTPADVTVWPLPDGCRESGVGSRGVGESAIRASAMPRARRRASCLAGSCWRADAMRCRTCGRVPRTRRTKRRQRLGSWPAPSGVVACWTPVRLPAARAWRCGRGCRRMRGSSPMTCACRRVALLAATLAPRLRPRAFRSSAATRRTCHSTVHRHAADRAPCSGLGTLRRDPDVRWRRTAADLAAFATTQRALIDEGLRALAPAGRLVYATCSSEPEENEALVAALLQERPDLQRLDLRQERLPPSMTPLLTDEGALRTWPHVHGLDAFFAVVLTQAVETGNFKCQRFQISLSAWSGCRQWWSKFGSSGIVKLRL